MHTQLNGEGGKGQQAQLTRVWGGTPNPFSYTWKGSDCGLVEGPSSKYTCLGFCCSSSRLSRPLPAISCHLPVNMLPHTQFWALCPPPLPPWPPFQPPLAPSPLFLPSTPSSPSRKPLLWSAEPPASAEGRGEALLFSRSVVSDSGTPWTAACQASLCSLSPGVCSNSCPSSR